MPKGRVLLLTVTVFLGTVMASEAIASGLETLLMPGKVAAAHAELEQECSQCHDRADRGRQAALCMACHEEVAADLASHRGFHGRLSGVATAQCRACHSEHLGREADIVKLSPPAFNHAQTDFALTGSHLTADCGACHVPGKKFREARSACADCHQSDEPHAGKLGKDCGSCHGTTVWSTILFDHGKTHFMLRDAHRETSCAACHFGNRYAGTPSRCASCHAPDDVHTGNRGADCAACHNTVAWTSNRYDHAKQTGFALEGVHSQLDCKDCHTTANIKDPLPRDCVGCHRAEDAHATRFGASCDQCHHPDAWKPVTFDHDRDGHYQLRGAHAQIDCHACHTAAVAEQKLGSQCSDCHATSDVHAGKLGEECASCHGVDAWRQDLLFDHDLTNFPLVGLHVAVPCHQCHVAPSYKDAEAECLDCHERDDRHRGALGEDCEACHSPGGWGIWEFDHQEVTGFALLGAHARATCEGCHRQPPDQVKLAGDCASCHMQDDVHLGQFGRQCQRCHGIATFKGARLQ
jgi:Cytochrome c7 and related cytochrome c